MDQILTTMEDTIDDVILSSAATTINRLEHLVKERCWESDL